MRLLCVFFPVILWGQFDYDRAAPLDARQEPLAERPKARMWGGSFAGARGTRVNYVLVEPKGLGRHPGVVFQHGGGQSMSNYIFEALVLAELGVTSLLVDAAAGLSRETMIDLAITQRRALDLLLRQVGVDGKRIGFVGHSYGGAVGGVLAGIETRIGTFVLIGASIAEVDTESFLPRTKAPVFVQCARFDTPDNVRACPEVHRLAGGPKTLTWYEDDHNFTSFEAMRDRLYWLERHLKLRGVGKVLARWSRPK